VKHSWNEMAMYVLGVQVPNHFIVLQNSKEPIHPSKLNMQMLETSCRRGMYFPDDATLKTTSITL